jgi:hypothetical protein
MQVSQMTCTSCEISVDASFPAPRLSRLPLEHQRFIELFILASGNLKSIAEQAGVSYPTVRSRLDRIIDTLQRVVAESTDGHEQPLSDKERTEAVSRLIKAI